MARRDARPTEALGCRPTWTCAPYQAGHRPRLGEDVAWGESDAVAFCNSVLGARTNRYGDFLDICAALAGRAPRDGLHLPENRRATVLVDTAGLLGPAQGQDAFYPVLGSWLGGEVGDAVAVIDGLPPNIDEDQLKALRRRRRDGAVGLFHVAGVTPEAPTVAAALGGEPPERTIALTPGMPRGPRPPLDGDGERHRRGRGRRPHFSLAEFDQLLALLRGRSASPCRSSSAPAATWWRRCAATTALQALEAAGIAIVADTCVVASPILPAGRRRADDQFRQLRRRHAGGDRLPGRLRQPRGLRRLGRRRPHRPRRGPVAVSGGAAVGTVARAFTER